MYKNKKQCCTVNVIAQQHVQAVACDFASCNGYVISFLIKYEYAILCLNNNCKNQKILKNKSTSLPFKNQITF